MNPILPPTVAVYDTRADPGERHNILDQVHGPGGDGRAKWRQAARLAALVSGASSNQADAAARTVGQQERSA